MVLALKPALSAPSESKLDRAGRASPRGSPEQRSWDLPLFIFLFLPRPVIRPRKLVLKMLDSKTTCSQSWTRGFVLSDHLCTVRCLTSYWLEKMNLLFSSHIVHRQVAAAFQVLVSLFLPAPHQRHFKTVPESNRWMNVSNIYLWGYNWWLPLCRFSFPILLDFNLRFSTWHFDPLWRS